MRTALCKSAPRWVFAGVSLVSLLTVGCSVAASDPVGEAPVPKVESRIAMRAVGDPQCSVTPEVFAWVNPFRGFPSTLPFYASDGTIPVGGAVNGVTVPPTIWFEQRLWTLIGRTPSDADSTMSVHPSTAVGYTWNAVEAVPATGYAQTDLDKLMAAFANIDPVDASVPQCSYGAAANVAWDPQCDSANCNSYNWWNALTSNPAGSLTGTIVDQLQQ